MTDHKIQQIGDVSPTLLQLSGKQDTSKAKDTACATCPIAMWFATKGGELICFCSALHRDVWKNGDGEATAIEFCDGREQALARLDA